jgi:hypothetical protein
VNAEPGGEAHGDADARHVGQPADDRFLLGAPEALLVACHNLPRMLRGTGSVC